MIADPAKSTLIIVESPTKANTISRYLPKSCTVMASKGHVVELAPNPTTGVYGVDVDNGYALEYVIEDDKKKVLADMRKALKGKEQLILATDEDREGESISWQLLNQLKPACPVFRMVFHEITKQAITKAFSSCREIDMDLVAAQEARRTVDRLQGYGISPMLSRKLGGKYSAGRVQSPGLKLIVEREKTRRGFVSSAYASVEAELSAEGSVFPALLTAIDETPVASSRSYDKETGRLRDGVIQLSREEGEKIAAQIMESDISIVSISYRDIHSQPSKPFITSTLQQDASRKLHKGVREIMSLAQSLYENGFITYMRTDSPTLSEECINAAREQVGQMFGSGYLSARPRNYKASQASAQEAHEAIRPAGDRFRRPEETGLSGDLLKLYTLIWKRTLATQMREAEKSSTTVVFQAGPYTLQSSGTTLKFPGYLALYSAAGDEDGKEGEEGILPKLDPDRSRVEAEGVAVKDHATEPPARYNEATLVQKLESEGIGRPSTYAAIISTLIDRRYVIRSRDQLVPTFTGFFVDAFLEASFPVYIGYGFTSRMEDSLDRIASGELGKNSFLDSFWKGSDTFTGLEKDIDSVRMNVRRTDAKTLHLSGLAYSFEEGGNTVHYGIKTSKFGPYLHSDAVDESTGKERMASIDQMKYFPGTFTDDEAKEILYPAAESPVEAAPGIFAMSGRYGEYFRRECDGRTVALPKGKKASGYTAQLVELLFELPKRIGEDRDGNPIMLCHGPFGFYAQCAGRNAKVADPLNVDIEALAADKPSGPMRKFADLEGKSLELLSGRYGAYIKWGDRNCALKGDEKKDPMSITEERAREIALSAPEPQKRAYRRRTASK